MFSLKWIRRRRRHFLSQPHHDSRTLNYLIMLANATKLSIVLFGNPVIVPSHKILVLLFNQIWLPTRPKHPVIIGVAMFQLPSTPCPDYRSCFFAFHGCSRSCSLGEKRTCPRCWTPTSCQTVFLVPSRFIFIYLRIALSSGANGRQRRGQQPAPISSCYLTCPFWATAFTHNRYKETAIWHTGSASSISLVSTSSANQYIVSTL